MAGVGYISDAVEIIKASWSHFQHDGAAACIFSGRSPLPPAVSANDICGGWTELVKVCRSKIIVHRPAESEEDSAPYSISDTENCHYYNGGFDDPNACEGDWEEDNESDIKQDNGIEAQETPEHWLVSAALNVSRLILLTWRSIKQAETGLLTVTAIETRTNTGNKKIKDRMGQYVSTWFYMLLDQEFHWEEYYGMILTSRMWMFVHTQFYSWWNESFHKLYQFL